MFFFLHIILGNVIIPTDSYSSGGDETTRDTFSVHISIVLVYVSLTMSVYCSKPINTCIFYTYIYIYMISDANIWDRIWDKYYKWWFQATTWLLWLFFQWTMGIWCDSIILSPKISTQALRGLPPCWIPPEIWGAPMFACERNGFLDSLFQIFPGWWFGTCFFPYIGNNHPIWLIFFRGVQTTNQFQKFVARQEWLLFWCFFRDMYGPRLFFRMYTQPAGSSLSRHVDLLESKSSWDMEGSTTSTVPIIDDMVLSWHHTILLWFYPLVI